MTGILALPDELLADVYMHAFADGNGSPNLAKRFCNEVALAPTSRLRSIAHDAFRHSNTLNVNINVTTSVRGAASCGKMVQSSFVQVINLARQAEMLDLRRHGASLQLARNMRVVMVCSSSVDVSRAAELLSSVVKVAERLSALEICLWAKEGEEELNAAVRRVVRKDVALKIFDREQTRAILFGPSDGCWM